MCVEDYSHHFENSGHITVPKSSLAVPKCTFRIVLLPKFYLSMLVYVYCYYISVCRSNWEVLLKLVNCEILSSCSNEYMDAYLLR